MAGYVSLQDVTKTYQMGEITIKAADGISFDVEKGEFVAIIGPSGSGKSTLLHILGGVDRPTAGKVFVNGKLITSNGYQIKQDDIISVRGLGRVQYKEMLSQTKRGRYLVTIHLYI